MKISATLQDFEEAFAKFRDGRSRDLRHDQAIWCAEIFLRDWGQLASEFGWTADDIFAPVRGAELGLIWWLAENGTDLVRSLGPDCAVNEGGPYLRPRWAVRLGEKECKPGSMKAERKCEKW